jgi:peptide deformylase
VPVDPAHLGVIHYPDPVLRRKAAPVAEVTDEVRAVARRMVELMREAEGIGLAAPQVGLPWRMFVTSVPENEERSVADDPPSARPEPTVYINPVLLEPEGRPEPMSEGCLSLPDIRGEVLRPPIISIKALDLEGRSFTLRGSGLLARCWQHEVDHLDGVLIIDRMSGMSRLKNRAAIRDLERG